MRQQNFLILVVDDDVQMVGMLRSNLETEGYRVDIATDGMTGKQKAWELKPSLIIADIFMPGVNGFAMVEAIHEHPELGEIPIIFVSGKADGSILPDMDGPIRRVALMKKPLFLPELNDLIRKFLN